MQTACPSPSNSQPAGLPAITYPWIPDQGDGTYRNPIIFADYSDPDVVRVGNDFYLAASSFSCTPGLPILHSTDLVNWTIIAHAIKNVPHARYAEVHEGCGVWAPAIRFHAGKFWIFFPTPDEGIYVTTAENPAGKWSEPHLVQEGKGLIDPCPLWDDDGKAWLVHAYAKSRAGIRDRLRVRPMAPDGSKLLGEGEIVYHNPERHPTIEGPKFLKKDGWYYILAPAGGVSTGWQVVLRSRNIYGPYEDKIVLEQGSTPINGAHQGALVDTSGGEWWFLHFQCVDLYGRVEHLQPVRWQDGWPLMGLDHDGNGIGEPVLRHPKPKTAQVRQAAVPQTSDEFDSGTLGLQWQWHANHREDWLALGKRASHLRLFSQHVPEANLAKTGSILSQKFPACSFAVETMMTFAPAQTGEEAGLVVIGGTYAALSLRRGTAGNQIVFQVNGADKFVRETAASSVRLRVQVADGGACNFSFATDGDFVSIPETYQASKSTWMGAKVGLFSLTPANLGGHGHADFDYFRFAPAGK